MSSRLEEDPVHRNALSKGSKLSAVNYSRFKPHLYWNKRCKPNPTVRLNLEQLKLLGRWLEIIPTQQTLTEAEIKS